jgi:hypothetical protein
VWSQIFYMWHDRCVELYVRFVRLGVATTNAGSGSRFGEDRSCHFDMQVSSVFLSCPSQFTDRHVFFQVLWLLSDINFGRKSM